MARDTTVTVVPWDHDLVEEINKNQYDGLFISNGPGDPVMASVTVKNLAKVLEIQSSAASPLPVFGICLGNQVRSHGLHRVTLQLLGLAAGAQTYKLKFGNRGQNQPCVDTRTGRCHLTMQNHGYAIDPKTLPTGWKELFCTITRHTTPYHLDNANDKTNEGIYHETKPFFSVQFHPEAKGGPKETEYLFDHFVHLASCRKTGKEIPFEHPLAVKHVPPPNLVAKKVSKVLVLGSGTIFTLSCF